MVALFVLILLLPSLLSATLAINDFRQLSEQTRLQVGRYADLASIYEEGLLAGVRQTLQSLLVALADIPPAQCSTRLAAAVSPYPELAEVFFVEPGGGVVCASDRETLGSSVASRAWFQRISAKRGFIVSDSFDGRSAGTPVFAAVQAIGDGTVRFSGAIAAAVKFDWLSLSRSIGLPADSIVEFLDGAGAPIIGPSSTGRPDRDALGVTDGQGPTVFDARDEGGRWRVYASTALAGTNIRILIGVPAAASANWIFHDLLFRIATLMVLWILILVAAWVGVDRLVIKWIRLLNRATLAFSRGEAVQLNLDSAPVELRQLGGTFSAMAAQVKTREAELRGSLMRQEWLVKETHHRVKNNLQIVASLVNLRSKALRSADARQAFADIQMPIRALALVHRHLYDSEERRHVDVKPIIAELCQLFQDGSEVGPVPVKLTSDMDCIPLNADRAVAVILLVTEALTSAFHHLHPGDGRVGAVSVGLHKDGDRLAVLEIADDATPPMGEEEAGRSSPADRLRLSLMAGLARQVGGTMTRTGPPGSGVSLRFRLDAPEGPH